MNLPRLAPPALLLALALAGCSHGPMGASGPRAVATLAPTTGNTTSGTVEFAQAGGKVMVSGEVRGLKPGAEHGFHVHEKGDCSSGDGMSTGGHFNPGNQPHGRHAAGQHHAGDLPSLRADAAGVAKFSFEAPSLQVGAGPANVVGRGLIVHRDPDDYATQPTGNAGPRLACAAIVAR
jgi:Cu-Zn family superoxide dismutase